MRLEPASPSALASSGASQLTCSMPRQRASVARSTHSDQEVSKASKPEPHVDLMPFQLQV